MIKTMVSFLAFFCFCLTLLLVLFNFMVEDKQPENFTILVLLLYIITLKSNKQT